MNIAAIHNGFLLKKFHTLYTFHTYLFAKNLLCFIKKGYFLRVQSASKTLIGNRGFITHLYAFSNINVTFANSTDLKCYSDFRIKKLPF